MPSNYAPLRSYWCVTPRWLSAPAGRKRSLHTRTHMHERIAEKECKTIRLPPSASVHFSSSTLLTVLLIVNVLFRHTQRSPTCIRRENRTWWDGFDDTTAHQHCCQAGSSTFINGPSKGISSVLAAFINVQVKSDPRRHCLG